MTYRIVVDARACVNGRPLALETVSGEPWLMHHLRAIRKAQVLDRTEVLVAGGWRDQIERILRDGEGLAAARVVTEAPPESPDLVVIRIEDVFVPRALAGRLRRRRVDLSPAVICSIASPDDLKKAEAFAFRDKKLVLSRYLNMPIARLLALRLRHSAVTPNQVSAAAGLTGLAAAMAAGVGGYWYDLTSGILLQVAFTLDLTDGYLARLTDRSTRFGHWLDTIIDEVTSFAIIVGVTVGIARSHGSGLLFLTGCVWLMAFHVASANFWMSKAYGLPAESATYASMMASRGVLPTLARMISAVLAVAHGLDSKFHLITLGLILNLKPALVVFMAAANLVVLAGVLAARISTRRELG